MTEKGGNITLLFGGGYLVYTGSKLVMEVQQSHPTNETMFIAIGVCFIIFGVILAGGNLLKMIRNSMAKKESDTIVEEIVFPEEITAPFPQKERTIHMVKVGDEKSDEPVNDAEANEDYEEVSEELSDDEHPDDEDIDDEDPDDEDTDDEDLFEQRLERI